MPIQTEGPLDLVLVAEFDDRVDLAMDVRSQFREYGALDGNELRPVAAQQLAVVALATWARRAGLNVSAHENVFASSSCRECFFRDLDAAPLVVGISTSLLMEPGSVARLAGWVRERAPNSLLVLGGASAQHFKEMRTLGDVTVVGAGETTLTELVWRVKRRQEWRSLPNLRYKGPQGEVETHSTPGPHPDELPTPDWSLLGMRSSLCYPIEASRGCRYNCAFCNVDNRGNQQMRANRLVVADMRSLFEREGARLLRFVDDNLTSWPERTEALCDEIVREGPPVEWGCFARADNFIKRPSLARAMYSAGCRWVYMGIESGSDAVLQKMHKGFVRKDILAASKITREAGLHVGAAYLIGFPGETRATVDETLEVISRVHFELATFSVFAVAAESDADQHVEQYGIKYDRGPGAMRWTHSTMDHEAAMAECSRAIEAVAFGMDHVYIGSEVRTMWQLRGGGLTDGEVLDYHRAIRDVHRARRRQDEAAESRELTRLGSFWARMNAVRTDRSALRDLPRAY